MSCIATVSYINELPALPHDLCLAGFTFSIVIIRIGFVSMKVFLHNFLSIRLDCDLAR